MSKRPCFRGLLDKQQMGRNFVPIGMEAPLQYLLNILTVGVLGKVSISNTQNPKGVC